jgi:hypothetical protein
MFSGPIAVCVAAMVGVSFDRIDLTTGERIKWDAVKE